jgi:RNA recognition motif-containing protein
MKIFVAGLPYDLDDAELTEIFEKFGTIASAKVAIDKETGKSKGFAFVDMPNEEEAKDAIESLNDISLGKKPMVVKAAEDRPSSGRPPGGGAPRFSPRSESGGFGNRDSRGGGYGNRDNRSGGYGNRDSRGGGNSYGNRDNRNSGGYDNRDRGGYDRNRSQD